MIETTCICCWSDAMMMLLCSAKVPFRDLSLQFIPHYSVMVFGYAAVEREVFFLPTYNRAHFASGGAWKASGASKRGKRLQHISTVAQSKENDLPWSVQPSFSE